MKLWAYECPECEEHHHTVRGVRIDDRTISVQCPHCGNVERIVKRNPVGPRAKPVPANDDTMPFGGIPGDGRDY